MNLPSKKQVIAFLKDELLKLEKKRDRVAKLDKKLYEKLSETKLYNEELWPWIWEDEYAIDLIIGDIESLIEYLETNELEDLNTDSDEFKKMLKKAERVKK